MERINIAELLKDCPNGMELDCTMYDNLYFDSVNTYYDTINCYTLIGGIRTSINFTKYGTFNNYIGAKCVIFPKGKTTWEGFVPPCKFKDGDIIFAQYYDLKYVSIVKQIDKSSNIHVYCLYGFTDSVFAIDEILGSLTESLKIRFATEKEKQKLFQAIKDSGYKWNAETKTLDKLPKFKVGDRVKHIPTSTLGIVIHVDNKGYYIDNHNVKGICYASFILEKDYELIPNKFDIRTLKPFESKVLVRTNNGKWIAAFYSHYDNDSSLHYCVVGGLWYAQCIPYKGNEYLLNTTNDCSTYYKTWEE